jgi:hypothetical protein
MATPHFFLRPYVARVQEIDRRRFFPSVWVCRFVRIFLVVGRMRDSPLGELVDAAVQDFGFVTREVFPFGQEPMELFACNDELLDLFLDQHDRLSPFQGITGTKYLTRSGNRGIDRPRRWSSNSRLSESEVRNRF